MYIFFLQKPWINTKAIRVFLPFKIKGMSQALEKKMIFKRGALENHPFVFCHITLKQPIAVANDVY